MFFRKETVLVGSAYGDALDLISGPLTKILVHHPTHAPSDLAGAAADIVGEAGVVTHSGARFIEISASGITKAHGVSALCERLGIDASDVLAFGDMPNDLAMLSWAGTSYAVANGHESVIAAADHVAPRNSDDGVAVTLARVFGLS